MSVIFLVTPLEKASELSLETKGSLDLENTLMCLLVSSNLWLTSVRSDWSTKLIRRNSKKRKLRDEKSHKTGWDLVSILPIFLTYQDWPNVPQLSILLETHQGHQLMLTVLNTCSTKSMMLLDQATTLTEMLALDQRARTKLPLTGADLVVTGVPCQRKTLDQAGTSTILLLPDHFTTRTPRVWITFYLAIKSPRHLVKTLPLLSV